LPEPGKHDDDGFMYSVECEFGISSDNRIDVDGLKRELEDAWACVMRKYTDQGASLIDPVDVDVSDMSGKEAESA